MRSEFPVLLVDDGELEDVRELLADLGADFAHLRGGVVPEQVHPPRDLFITTSRRAQLARDWPPHAGGPGRPVKIAIVTEDSQTARGMLRRLGYDFLVRRPVHPMALRLLVLRALYRGEEKRRETRVAVGYDVALRSGLRRRRALLADLSTRGCRLIAEKEYDRGTGMSVLIPAEIAQGKELALKGRVLRSSVEAGAPKRITIAVGFEKLSPTQRRRLVEIVRERTTGPAVLQDSGGRRAPVSRAPRRGLAPKRPRCNESDEKRRNRRAQYGRSVVALARDGRQVLLGRDLSIGGMRVEPNPELSVGARVKLAIYGAAREEPFLLRATVARDDGDHGLALRFEPVEEGVAARLEALVAGLPSVEALLEGEARSLGTVLSRLVSR